MDEEQFAAKVQEAFEGLPLEYRAACRDISIQSPSLPDAETLQALGLTDPFGLLGLYHGVSLTNKSIHDLPSRPDIVMIYRLPILDYAQSRGLPVERVIEHVLVHEIGHHFGFSDDDMASIEAQSDKD